MRGLLKAHEKPAAAKRRSTRKCAQGVAQRRIVVSSASIEAPSEASVEARAFHELLAYAKLSKCGVDIKHCDAYSGNGLIAKAAAKKGEVGHMQ